MTLLAAGRDTTATELSWALERLIRNPAVLPTAVQAAKASAAGDPAGDDYLDAVIKETLRVRPVVFAPQRMVGMTLSPTTWFPFGGGNRRCLGANFAMVESRVLREIQSRVELRTTTAPDERSKLKYVTLVPHRGARIYARAIGKPLINKVPEYESAPSSSRPGDRAQLPPRRQ